MDSPPSGRDSLPICYGLTLFTQRWREIRDFYVEVLRARILSERPDRYVELDLGGLPICLQSTDSAEMVSQIRLYLSIEDLSPLMQDLRKRGVIVVKDGPYAKFRDPEGRMIKMSESLAILA